MTTTSTILVSTEIEPSANGHGLATARAAKAAKRVPMGPVRKRALAAGILYVLTFVSMPTLFLYGAVKSGNYIIGAGPDTAAVVGGILEMIVALAGIATAVVLYPVLKRQNETVALGLVGSRTVEAATIFAGVVILMTIVALRQAGVGASALPTGHALVTMYNRTFLYGQSFFPVVDDLLLGYLLYKTGLVPRILPMLAFAGAGLLIVSDIGVMFSLFGQFSTLGTLPALGVALFEFSLGIYLIVKGFRPAAIATLMHRQVGAVEGSGDPARAIG